MSDEIAENGTANGDVPEIELIIKVESILHVLLLKIIWLQSAVKSTTLFFPLVIFRHFVRISRR